MKNQAVKFFYVDYGLDPFDKLEYKINKWISEESAALGLKMVVESCSHNVTTLGGHMLSSAMLLYHYE